MKFSIPYFPDAEKKLKSLINNIDYTYFAISNAISTGQPNSIGINYDLIPTDLINIKKTKKNLLLNGLVFDTNCNFRSDQISYFLGLIKPELVTFSLPAIYHMLKHSKIKYYISAIKGIKTIEEFVSFTDINKIDLKNIEGITLSHDNTKQNPDKRLIEFLQKKLINPSVLVTESCFFLCPFRYLHYQSFSNSFIEPEVSFVNYYQIFCVIKRLRYSYSLLDLAGLLLPEQIPEFQKKTNISSFKISGRSMSPEWILNTTKAYLRGQSPENLFEIIVFTSPFLEDFGMKIQDLFYLDSKAYNEIYYELIEQTTPKLRQSFLKKKAAELFLAGKLKINDPNSQYDVINGELKLTKKGDYLKRLETELDNYLISNNMQKLKAAFEKSYEKTY